MIPSRSNKADDAENRERMASLRRLQSEYLIIDQDIHKKVRLHDALVAEIRKMKYDYSRLEVTLQQKRTDEAKFARELALLQSDASRLKKRMNLIS